jgi:hypothetical protein
MGKKIILPSDDEVKFYAQNKELYKGLHPNPIDNLEIKNVKKEIKNKGNFCSTTKIFSSWKDMVKSVIDNADYKNDKR